MPKRYQLASIATCMGCGKEMPTHHLTMNTIDLGYVIPGAYSGLSRIRGCSSLCCTDQVSVGALETNEPSVAPTKLRLVHFLLWQAAKPSGDKCTPYRMPYQLWAQKKVPKVV